MDLVFEEPQRAGKTIAGDLTETLRELQAHPDRWIKVFEGKASTADSRRSTLYQHVIPDLVKNGGTYTVATERVGDTDNKKVFVRFTPSNNGDAG